MLATMPTWTTPLPRSQPQAPHQGQILKAIRKERGLIQKDVADAFGLTLEGYRAYEKGYSRLKVDALPRMAAALGVSPGELASRLDLTLPSDSSPTRTARRSLRPQRPGH